MREPYRYDKTFPICIAAPFMMIGAFVFESIMYLVFGIMYRRKYMIQNT